MILMLLFDLYVEDICTYLCISVVVCSLKVVCIERFAISGIL